MEVLRAATGLFAVSPSINPTQFQKFVEQLELADQYPGSQGLGYLTRVKRDGKVSFGETSPQHTLKDFHVWPEKDQDMYALASHFEPLYRDDTADNTFDLHTDPVCSAAMENARDSGLPTASARVMLPGANKEAGFLIYVPIYENDRTPTTVSERQAALSGFVYSQFRAADFLKSVLAIKHTSDIDLQLYDGPQPSIENLLADTASEASERRPRNPSTIHLHDQRRSSRENLEHRLCFASGICFCSKPKHSLLHGVRRAVDDLRAFCSHLFASHCAF